ncbi:flavodoxin family protein [Veillonella agrestimuris]|uniref:flavodoxin family protein n=1 Tax=Veillonella agrestimuris TaxID=2941340 RepID=UPI00203FB214|nr:flavodoxin family protein [Veillonella agrestimuris]
MAKIMILNGSARKNGNTSALINSFVEGARAAGNEVVEFYLQDMIIHGCLGCNGCTRGTKDNNLCVQNDDMKQIYSEFMMADVVVFASPVYFWTITGTLKIVADRLYAALKYLGYGAFSRKSVLLMTAGGSDYSQASRWYETYERNLGWINLGEILGARKTAEAKALGASIQ